MNTNNSSEIISCYLYTDNNVYPSIYLPHSKPIIVGRNIESKITDLKCSREQVRLCANYTDKYITVEQLGKLSCGYNGVKTVKNEKYLAKHGDQLEVLYGKYVYKFEFNPPPSDDTLKIFLQGNKSSPSTKKRSFIDFDSDNEDNNMPSTSKKCKIVDDITSASTSTATTQDLTSVSMAESSNVETKNISNEKWENIDKNHLLIYTSQGCEGREKIAAFDMDNTLITTKSGAVFPKHTEDWKILYPDIPKKLKKLWDNNYKVIIFTNQNGLQTGKTKESEFKEKIKRVVAKLGVPMMVFIAASRDRYRKPLTGMWDRLVKFNNDNIKIDRSECFYVGDAAGRPKDWMLKAKKDHSSVDRMFAKNVGLKFYTPEEYFLGYKTAKFNDPLFDPNKLSDDIPVFIPDGANETCDTQEVIVMVGGPGTGKTHIALNHLQDYHHVNRDKLGSWQKCVTLMENLLSEGKSVVIDNTNPDVASRKRFIDVAKAKNVPVRCFVMTTPIEHAKHNNRFRELTNANHAVVSDIIINTYYKNYVEPTTNEGFTEIVKVNCVPKFNNSEHRQLYKMHLLEK